MTDETAIEDQNPKRKKDWGKIGITIISIAFAITILAFTLGYFALMQDQFKLRQSLANVNQQLKQNDNHVAQLKQSLAEHDAALQKSQTLATKQEQLITEWQEAQKGDTHHWQIVEAKYLVKWANEQLQFNKRPDLAISLLEQAQLSLQALDNPNLIEVKKSIANDLAVLQALPKNDMTSLYLRVVALDNLVDKLQLKNNAEQAKPVVTPSQPPPDEAWWEKGLRKSWEGLRQIVIVRRTDMAALPLVMPDEKMFIFQNLHAQMEGVLWAVMHQDDAIYQVNLARTMGWVQAYFDADAPAVTTFLQGLDELRKVHFQLPDVNLSATLQLFDQLTVAPPEQATQ